MHRERKARATIVLTPVDNPTAYGLVETDADGNIRRFLEKPQADEITTNNINAGIYVLEPDTFDRIPSDGALVDRAELFPVARRARRDVRRVHLRRATGSTSARPKSTSQVHRDIMDGRFVGGAVRRTWPPATHGRFARRAHRGRRDLEGPCFIDEGVLIKAGARIGPYSVIGRGRRRLMKSASVGRCHPLAQLPRQPRGHRLRTPSSAATAISAAASASTAARCSETTPP